MGVCVTVIIFPCDEYGHKILGLQSSYKKNEVDVIEDQKTKFKKPGHSQMWIENIEQVNKSEVDCCKNNCGHVTSIV